MSKPEGRKHSSSIKFLSIFLLFVVIIMIYLANRVNEFKGTSEDERVEPKSATEEKLTFFNYCLATTARPMELRFSRALSLLLERTRSIEGTKTPILYTLLPAVFPCLDIQYCNPSQMAGAEGLFSFSPESANRNRMLICVSEDYREEDDLLTTLLLAHEAMHAIQFVGREIGNRNPTVSAEDSCYQDEALAFTEQTLLFAAFTPGEQDSLIARSRLKDTTNPRIAGFTNLLNIFVDGAKAAHCINIADGEERFKCAMNAANKRFEQMVRNNPFYQRQCGYKN